MSPLKAKNRNIIFCSTKHKKDCKWCIIQAVWDDVIMMQCSRCLRWPLRSSPTMTAWRSLSLLQNYKCQTKRKWTVISNFVFKIMLTKKSIFQNESIIHLGCQWEESETEKRKGKTLQSRFLSTSAKIPIYDKNDS